MIRSRAQELGGLPGGSPDTMHSEYLRGKMEERNHSAGAFTKRGNDVWAERSGRTFFSDGSELKGGAMDFASPVNGSGMGNLSRLTGGVKENKGFPVSMLRAMTKEAKTGGAADALEVGEMMQRGANRARGISGKIGMGMHTGMGKGKSIDEINKSLAELKKKMEARRGSGKSMDYGDVEGAAKPKKSRAPNARAEIVKKVMRDRGVKMIEASKIVKREGLY